MGALPAARSQRLFVILILDLPERLSVTSSMVRPAVPRAFDISPCVWRRRISRVLRPLELRNTNSGSVVGLEVRLVSVGEVEEVMAFDTPTTLSGFPIDRQPGKLVLWRKLDVSEAGIRQRGDLSLAP
jgi:hypothetical protein